ncbi:MAG: copper amine oxidase N-terminal domain-containing protein [Bacillota bacterium]
MKKKFLCLVVLSLLLLCLSQIVSALGLNPVNVMSYAAQNATKSQNNNEIIVQLNGEKLVFDVKPYIKNGRTLVPFRGILEAFGAKVDWNGAEKSVYAHNSTTYIYLKIGDSFAYVNGRKITLDVLAEIKDGRTFLPLRFISENLGAHVDWDNTTRTVTILYKKTTFTLGETMSFEGIKVLIEKVEKNAGNNKWLICGKASLKGKEIIIDVIDNDGLEAPGLIYFNNSGEEMDPFEVDVYIPKPDFDGKYIVIKLVTEDGKQMKIGEYVLQPLF